MRPTTNNRLTGSSRESLLAVLALVTGLALGATPAGATTLPTGVDIVVVVDESGSMATEHAFIGATIEALDDALVTLGISDNRYGLLGFGATNSHSGVGSDPHKHTVGSGDFGTDEEFNTWPPVKATGTGSLVTSGSQEDGWEALEYALNNYTFRGTDFAKQIILITDENRDDTDTVTMGELETLFSNASAKLNAIINVTLKDTTLETALGTNGTDAYVADGSGGFTTSTYGTCSDSGNADDSCAQYGNLALATGGAIWDLNQLRAGGNTADSFVAALLEVKVEEIITPPPSVPEPTSLLLLSAGLLLLGARFPRR